MIINIGVVQFPGSNTERETFLAIQRANMNPLEILWNSDEIKIIDLALLYSCQIENLLRGNKFPGI